MHHSIDRNRNTAFADLHFLSHLCHTTLLSLAVDHREVILPVVCIELDIVCVLLSLDLQPLTENICQRGMSERDFRKKK